MKNEWGPIESPKTFQGWAFPCSLPTSSHLHLSTHSTPQPWAELPPALPTFVILAQQWEQQATLAAEKLHSLVETSSVL